MYEDNICYIPGINGLDLDIKLNYDSSDYVIKGNDESAVGLALGWSFGFTSLINQRRDTFYSDDLPKYIRFADGTEYELISGSANNEIRIKDYPFKDMKLGKCSVDNAKYYVEYADGKKEYFDSHGRIIIIADRFNNKITFSYGGYGSFDITDIRGGVTQVTFPENKGDSWDMNIKTPDNKNVTYSFKKVGTNNCYLLERKTDQMGRITTFKHNYEFYKSKVNTSKSYLCANLTEINFPTGFKAIYTFEDSDEVSSRTKYFRIKNKYYEMNGKHYNKEEYIYLSTNSMGYIPPRIKRSTLKDYTYTVKIKNEDESFKIYTFNKYNLKSKEEAYYKTNELFNTLDYDYYYPSDSDDPINPYPKSVKSQYNGANRTEERYEYDLLGNVVKQWRNKGSVYSAAQSEQAANDEYATTYEYSSKADTNTEIRKYNLPLKEEYKQDSKTTIKKEYVLTSDSKNIDSVSVWTTTVKNNAPVTYLTSKIKYTYNSDGSVNSVIEYGDAQATENPTKARITSYGYDPNTKDLISITRGGITNSYTYDSMGRQLSETDGKGYTTRYTYDAFGSVTCITYPKNKENKTPVCKYDYDYTNNTLLITNEINGKIKYEYDPAGNLEKILYHDENGKAYDAEKYEYDNKMLVIKKTSYNDKIETYADYQYDVLRRIKKETITEKNNGSIKILSEKENNYICNEFYTVESTVKGDANSEDIKSRVMYNARGLVSSETVYNSNGTSPLQNITYSHDYVGNVVKTVKRIDTLTNQELRYKYDYEGRMTESKYHFSSSNTEQFNSSYTYDMIGRKLTEKNANGTEAAYTYDENDRVVIYNVPFVDGSNKAYTYYEYDSNGNMTLEKIRNSRYGMKDTYMG